MIKIPLPDELQYVREDGAPYLRYTEFNHSPVHRIRLTCIIQMLDRAISGGRGKILEIGCGVGNIAIPIASLGHDVTACDIHGPSIEEARQRNCFSNLTFVHGSIDSVNSGEYDAVILTEVLEHVRKYREMMGLIVRLMKKDATLIITVPNGCGITELLCRPSYALKKWPGGAAVIKAVKRVLKTADPTTVNFSSPHVNFFTLQSLDGLFEDCRVEVASFRRFFFLWPLWETFFSERGYPPDWPERDFLRSQKLPPPLCALWAFALKRKSVL